MIIAKTLILKRIDHFEEFKGLSFSEVDYFHFEVDGDLLLLNEVVIFADDDYEVKFFKNVYGKERSILKSK